MSAGALAARLDALAVRDAELRVFGADAHYYHRLPPLAESELRAVEERLEVALPPAYRSFVGTIASGGVGPGYGFAWLPAVLVPSDLADDEWLREVGARMFRDDAGREWAARRFAPLDDAEIERRLASLKLPPPLHARMRAEAAWTKSFEARQAEYVRTLTGLVRETGRKPETAKRAFPFRARQTAAPDIDAIDWGALDDEARETELARLRSKFGFDTATDGTVPLCDYGDGVSALLVVTGPEAGNVWTFDSENLVIHPGGPNTERGDRSFDGWFEAWLAAVEREIDAGPKRRAAKLWR